MHQRCNELRNEISSIGGSLRSRCSDLKHEISSISGSVRSQSRCSGSLRSHRKVSEISELIRDSMSRDDSLPPVLEKEPLRTGSIHSEHQMDGESVHEDDEHDRNRGAQYSASMKKSRTSSFVGQMAQEIFNRVRSASFASQVAQDGFITSIQQEQNEEFESQPEELSGILCQKVQKDLQKDSSLQSSSIMLWTKEFLMMMESFSSLVSRSPTSLAD
ncbi:hypothetical protein NPIL_133641 [Nephila pilipes]|uniref:Uncharacterized protein n=1 Tax=Nephila pilipes TaxID=299642 RepID=A0A8X6PC94_NEPPI|nr:hypothetical protein NPIL_133641 [Nephila pilipes]